MGTTLAGNTLEPPGPCAGCIGSSNLNTRELCEGASSSYQWTAISCGVARDSMPASQCPIAASLISLAGSTCCEAPLVDAPSSSSSTSSGNDSATPGIIAGTLIIIVAVLGLVFYLRMRATVSGKAANEYAAPAADLKVSIAPSVPADADHA